MTKKKSPNPGADGYEYLETVYYGLPGKPWTDFLGLQKRDGWSLRQADVRDDESIACRFRRAVGAKLVWTEEPRGGGFSAGPWRLWRSPTGSRRWLLARRDPKNKALPMPVLQGGGFRLKSWPAAPDAQRWLEQRALAGQRVRVMAKVGTLDVPAAAA